MNKWAREHGIVSDDLDDEYKMFEDEKMAGDVKMANNKEGSVEEVGARPAILGFRVLH